MDSLADLGVVDGVDCSGVLGLSRVVEMIQIAKLVHMLQVARMAEMAWGPDIAEVSQMP